MRWTNAVPVAVLLLGSASSLSGQASRSPAEEGFRRLAGLEGSWAFRDSLTAGIAARPIHVSGSVDYELVSNGLVLQERVHGPEHGTANMVSMIWVEGDQLVLDHYCSSGTRPRLVSPGLVGNEIRFVHDGHSGVRSEDAGHIHGAVFRFGPNGRFTSEWAWRARGDSHDAERHHVPRGEPRP